MHNFSSLLLDVYVQLNMFRASIRPSLGAQLQQQQQQPLVSPLERGGSSAVGRGRAGRHLTEPEGSLPHHPTSLISKWSLILRFPYQTLYVTLLSPIRATCPTHLILLYFSTQIIIILVKDTYHKAPSM
jgi:hypothetical protein